MLDHSLILKSPPRGWTLGNFSDVCERVQDAASPSANGERLYLGLEHLASGQPSLDGRGKESDVTSGKSVFSKDDVLFGKLRPYLRKSVVAPEDGICSTDILVFRAKGSCPEYLCYLTHSDEFIGYAKSTTSGVQHPRTSWAALSQFKLHIPPLNEQRKIAGVLGLVQRALAQQQRLLRLTAELKKALLLQLFAYGLYHDSQKQTDLGPLAQSWDAVELGSVADVINGFAFKSEDYVSSGVLNFRVVNIRDEGVIDTSSDTKFLPNEFMQTHKQYLLSEGDILLVMVGATRGKLGFIPKRILPALMNQNMWRIVPKSPNELHRKYLYHFLTIAVPKFVREFSESARGFFKKSDFRSIKLPKPTFTEQEEIADAIDNVEQRLDLHRRKHAALSALFRTLLHELMTARIRVHDLDLQSI